MYSHEQLSSNIWASFISSSLYETLLFFGFNGAWCILKCVAASWLISNAAGLISKWKCSEIDGSLNSRLYIASSPILVRLRKPWKVHSWSSTTDVVSNVIEGLREFCEVWWWLLSIGAGSSGGFRVLSIGVGGSCCIATPPVSPTSSVSSCPHSSKGWAVLCREVSCNFSSLFLAVSVRSRLWISSCDASSKRGPNIINKDLKSFKLLN